MSRLPKEVKNRKAVMLLAVARFSIDYITRSGLSPLQRAAGGTRNRDFCPLVFSEKLKSASEFTEWQA